MAYTINLTNGQLFASVPDGTINNDSSQVIVGKNYAGYGEFIGENFIHLLESGSATTSPLSPLTGQLWFDSISGVLKVFNGITFKNLGSASSDVTAPASPVLGDLWYDPVNKQLFVYDTETAGWILVGPAFTSGSGVSGAIVDIIEDVNGIQHTVVKLYVQDDVVSITSKDAEFTPGIPIIGFESQTIKPGTTLSAGLPGGVPLFEGTARRALTLIDLSGNPLPVSEFLLRDGTNEISGTIVPDGPSSRNFGSINRKFQTIYSDNFEGTSLKAKYADLAERFETDTVLQPGTVVELGGEKEITESLTKLSDSVFGVISTSAAYLMNSDAGDDNTHPPVAMNGRVPVRVVGTINKGDRLVSAGNGLAKAALRDEATSFNVIGRSLENKDSNVEGVVEAIVRIN